MIFKKNKWCLIIWQDATSTTILTPPPFIPTIPKTAPTLPRKNVKTELNGLLKILLKPNLNALDAKSAVNPKTFLNPIVSSS